MFGIGNSKRIAKLEKELSELRKMPTEEYVWGGGYIEYDIKQYLTSIKKRVDAFSDSIARLEEKNKIAINSRWVTEVGLHGMGVKPTSDGELDLKDAILMIADYHGIKFHVEPEKPKAIILVKEENK